MDNVDVIFHEAGHSIFQFFGTFIRVAAGSGFQVLLPLGIALYFFKNNQKLSGSLVLMWVGQSLINVSIYAADAINMQLDLLGGDSVGHDWNYLLSATNTLKYTPYIASDIFALGVMFILVGTVLGLYYSVKDTSRETGQETRTDNFV